MKQSDNKLMISLSNRVELKGYIEKLLKEDGAQRIIYELQNYYDLMLEAENKLQDAKTNLNQLIDVIPKEVKKDFYHNYKGVLGIFIHDMVRVSLGISDGFSWGPS
jgi:hypothetical protein